MANWSMRFSENVIRKYFADAGRFFRTINISLIQIIVMPMSVSGLDNMRKLTGWDI